MTPELFQRVRDAVEAVRAMPEAERTAYLAGLDAEVRREAADLLAYEGEAAVVDRPLVPGVADSEALPASVGRYRVVSALGEGGMGRVYLARQEQPQRDVAVKVVRAGMLSRSVLRRFELEAELLGQLQHPGIAQILEAGVAEVRYADGRGHLQPFYAMELVRGLPLTAHARGMSLRARLGLVAEVADAVEHAHRRGIVHRDLKPGNILVEESGRAKVLDFGVARALGTDLKATTQTNAGQIVGTLAYMSPEQTLGDSRAIDTRSDVYSLGVVLYEVLTGRLPLEVGRLPLPEAARAIREDEPTRAGSLVAELRGDPETITAKAMEKDPERRYQSAGELAADLRRFLSDEPIYARPVSTLYQLRKFAKRNKSLVGGVVATVVVLAGGIATTSIAAARASRQRAVAEQRGREADRSAYRATIAAAQAGLEAGDGPLVRRSLDEADPALRGWEWGYFSFLADRSVLRIEGCAGRDSLLAADASGKSLACLGRDGVLRVFDAGTGVARWATPRALGGGARGYGSLGFAAGGGLVVLADQARGVRALDAASGEDRWEALGPGPWDCRCSPDGKTLAAVARDHPDLVLLRAADGAEVRRVALPSVTNYVMGFTADGGSVTVQSFVNSFAWRFWTVDLATGRAREEAVGPAAWHWHLADGRFAGVVADGNELRVVDHAGGRDLGRGRLAVSRGAVPLVMSPDVRRLAAVEGGVNLRILDVDSGETSCVEHLPSLAASVAFVSPTRLATALEDGTIRVWDAAMAPAPLTVRTAETGSSSVSAVAPGADRVLCADWGSVSWWDTRTGRRLASLHLGSVLPTRVVPSRGGERFALITQRGSVQIVTVRGDALSVVTSPELTGAGQVKWVAWDRGGAVLRVAVGGGKVFELEAAGGAVVGERAGGVEGVVVAEDEGRLVVATPGAVVALRREDLSELWRAPWAGLEPASAAAGVMAGGGRLAVAAPGMMRLLGMEDGRALAEWPSADAGVAAVAWTPDGRRVAVLSDSATVRLIDPGTGETTAAIHVPEMRAGAMAFSPDARRLVVAGPGRLRVLETFHDPGLSAERDLVRRAAAVVEPLYERLRLAEDVAREVAAMAGLPEELREECLRQVAVRGIDVNRLNERAWAVVMDPTSAAAENREAVRLARACVEAAPERWETLNTLVLAELRAGDAARALEASDRCVALYRRLHGQEHAADLAVRALILARLGRRGESQEALERLGRGGLAAGEIPEVRRLAEEARRVLAGEGSAGG